MSESSEDKETPPAQQEAEQVKSDQEPSPSVVEPPKDGELSSEPKNEVSTNEGQRSEWSPPEKKSEECEATTVNEKAKSVPAPQPIKQPQYHHDWYQTERDVCVNIMIKKLKKENVRVDITETTVNVSITLKGGEKYNLELKLAHPIVQGKSTTKVLGTKVEIKLRKSQGLQWKTLEATNLTSQPTGGAQNTHSKSVDPIHKYPSSSHYTRDWDKVVAEVKDEEKNEKPEGDAALNKLFQQIYRDGNEEVRKAMNKSFVESGGTVLSTNWGEVGKDKVERKPPDGMEWKDYEN